MKIVRDYKPHELEEILVNLSKEKDVSEKVKLLYQKFSGVEYISSPLSQEGEEEALIFYLKKFDCVTLVETIISLILKNPKSEEEVIKNLIKIRYQNGKVSYKTRNHYMHNLASENGDIFENITENFSEKFIVFKNLSHLKSLPEIKAKISVLSYANFKKYLKKFKDGDILFFLSEDNPEIDYFHVGILFERKIFHASKRYGKVILEEVDSFFKRTYCPPLTILRLKDAALKK